MGRLNPFAIIPVEYIPNAMDDSAQWIKKVTKCGRYFGPVEKKLAKCHG